MDYAQLCVHVVEVFSIEFKSYRQLGLLDFELNSKMVVDAFNSKNKIGVTEFDAIINICRCLFIFLFL